MELIGIILGYLDCCLSTEDNNKTILLSTEDSSNAGMLSTEDSSKALTLLSTEDSSNAGMLSTEDRSSSEGLLSTEVNNRASLLSTLYYIIAAMQTADSSTISSTEDTQDSNRASAAFYQRLQHDLAFPKQQVFFFFFFKKITSPSSGLQSACWLNTAECKTTLHTYSTLNPGSH